MKYKLFILLLFANFSLFAQSFTISGYISDKKTGETLIGATVSNKANKQIGVSANTYGFYSLKLPKR